MMIANSIADVNVLLKGLIRPESQYFNMNAIKLTGKMGIQPKMMKIY